MNRPIMVMQGSGVATVPNIDCTIRLLLRFNWWELQSRTLLLYLAFPGIKRKGHFRVT